jgi:predicted secreted Zn-dependent protease
MIARITQLFSNALKCRKTIVELQRRVATLTEERNQARRDVCHRLSHDMVSARHIAKYIGWDCFEEDCK